VVIVLILIYIGLRSRFKAQVAGFLLELVREAEEKYGGKTGPIKKAYVCEVIYSMLPPLAKLVLPQFVISKLIDIAAEELTEYLENIAGEVKNRLI
jgi:hypothetical protein